MNNILSFNTANPNEVAIQIASRVKARRLELNLTQEGLSSRAGVKFETYRRFEQTEEILLRGLLQIGFALNSLTEFNTLFAQKQYQLVKPCLKVGTTIPPVEPGIRCIFRNTKGDAIESVLPVRLPATITEVFAPINCVSL